MIVFDLLSMNSSNFSLQECDSPCRSRALHHACASCEQFERHVVTLPEAWSTGGDILHHDRLIESVGRQALSLLSNNGSKDEGASVISLLFTEIKENVDWNLIGSDHFLSAV
jgi:hypothetical protein